MLSPPLEDLDEREPGSPLPGRPGECAGRERASIAVDAVLAVVAAVFGVFFLWLAISLGSALTNPALGSSMGARAAEWFREHGGATIVNWAENEWYSHHQPKVGGALPPGTIHKPKTVTTAPAAATVAHLPPPAPIVPLASPPVAGEGQWSPAGRLVDGVPAVYETLIRPSAIHTSFVVGVAWMDPMLLKATLYSGSQIPGGGPFTHTAPISPTDATSLVAAFNAGFLMSAANGGYYTDGKTIIPLRTGAASFVVYKNGSFALGQWGSDVSMTPSVVSVRQNLDLLVDNGQIVPAAYNAELLGVGRDAGRRPLRLAFRPRDHGERRPALRRRPRARHLQPGQHHGPCRSRPGHGARHQHRLGQLQHLPAVDGGRRRPPPPTAPSSCPE